MAIVVGGLGGGAAGAAVLKQPARYESVATLTIDQPTAIVFAASEGVISKLNSLRAKYVTLLYTSVFTRPVADELHVPADDVARSLRIGAPGPSLVLFIAARTKDPAVSKKIAQSLAKHLVSYLQEEQDRAFIPKKGRIIFSIVVPAANGVKVEPTKRRAAAVGAGTAAVLFAAVYVLMQFLAVRRRR